MLLNGQTNPEALDIKVDNLNVEYADTVNANSGQDVQSSGLTPAVKSQSNVLIRVTLNPVVTGNVTLNSFGWDGGTEASVELDNSEQAKVSYSATVAEIPMGGVEETWSIDFNPSVEWYNEATSSWEAWAV